MPGGIYIADSNTASLLRNARNFDNSVPLIIIPAGEEHKNLENIEKILETALNSGLGRDSLFIGFGGGVITDMAAFAASLYMRGTRLILVPTTLLAMVDAAVGGKTGVDFLGYKNLAGSFYPAQEIHVIVHTLDTLSDREFRSGLAEVLKIALISDRKLFQLLSQASEKILNRDPEILEEVIFRSIKAKAEIVKKDLHESGIRKYLNLGHTFAHALETAAGLGSVSHGEAVAWGISRALALGIHLGITDREYYNTVVSVFDRYGWNSDPMHPALRAKGKQAVQELLSAMKNDKKKQEGTVRFVLQNKLNSTVLMTTPDSDIEAILE
ncbi:3-dehydroquinate synthase [Brucepastera parasyntrophica]|uniref:3-dehydroquinate synthase n=1 Tax=Brucepastera parasyntrophica TaxID=2880008 RepID=UPI00210B9F49|nr:3-dehydroquinate synthase [Brucepastera parasyntrophica]ULQ59840.1 3-dehydroquinate synthase [Brucepastera parasyntrophica]